MEYCFPIFAGGILFNSCLFRIGHPLIAANISQKRFFLCTGVVIQYLSCDTPQKDGRNISYPPPEIAAERGRKAYLIVFMLFCAEV